MHVVTDPATMATEYDFIVVGGMSGPPPSPPLNTTNSPGGTAGCVVAGRLAENPNVKVLVIEAGITNPGDVDAITTPARAFELRDSKYDWSYKTTMIDRPEYTRIEKPNTRGKTLGGSSCLNYYTWIPGSAATFDEWADFGGEEWTWKTLQPYFYKPATYHDDAKLHSPELKYIGESGPIPVSHSDLIPEMAPFRDALTEAWISKGEPLTDDVHNGTMRGLWKAVNSIHAGKRSSSWLYLVDKPNITVLGHTIASRLVFAPGSTTATGITALLPDNNTALTFTARRELILSLGVFETPKLLLLSGIGPGPAGTFLPSPHVGRNLLDHPILPHVFKLRPGHGLDPTLLHAGPLRDAAISQYRWKGTGALASGLLELVGLPRIDERLEKVPAYVAAKAANGGLCPFGPRGQPHFEIDFVPIFSDAFQWHIPAPEGDGGEYMTVIVDLLRPLSKSGTVDLVDGDARTAPRVNLAFFEDALDLVAMREGVRWVDELLMEGEGMRDVVVGDYPWRMPRAGDEAMEKMILERSQTGFREFFFPLSLFGGGEGWKGADKLQIRAEVPGWARTSTMVSSMGSSAFTAWRI